ncbi:MAG TPA: cyanophycinase [Bacteroidales bacterium]|jgi:cyanophycinase|nr:cyanophycinase [Bacteroidales bacterium]HOH14394.1 cyanophycinase [Bacteroidales bacterium]HPX52781.1 cyanophycinase [Bacteroidales bacterium]HQB51402.1 cyanophycinase [Bacteroidales bacterium]
MLKSIAVRMMLLTALCAAGYSCRSETPKEGKLFILGGGNLSSSIISKIVAESGLDKGGYGVILPMSSEEPDTAIFYTTAYFTKQGLNNVHGLHFVRGKPYSQARIDSIRNARMVFISGGDQSRFMEAVEGTPIKAAIHEAFEKGNVVCGTSAGAALMSKTMITGNELKNPDADVVFATMEAENVETIEGLGMLEKVIIDQHFIIRKRLNRSVCACIEHPEQMVVGIDEPAGIFVEGNTATVLDAQVVVLRNPVDPKSENGLLGARNIQLDVYLPGESFRILK